MVKRNKIYLLISVFVLVFSLSFISATAISDELHLNIQTTNPLTGEIITGTFDFAFNITTDSDCSNVIYSDLTSLTTDSRGIISYYLENVNLDFSDQYYLCYYRDSVLINSSKIARSPYSFTSKNVTISGLIIDSGLDMGSYNISAEYLFGDGSYLTNLNVSEINLNDYVPYTNSVKNVVLGSYNFSVDGSDFFVDANTGNVGIGTANPKTLLHLHASTESNLLINSNSNSIGSAIQLTEDSGVNQYGVKLQYDGSADKFHILTGGSTLYERFTIIRDSGNIGINTTTPQNTLNVIGDGNFTGNLYSNGELLSPTLGTLTGSGTANYISKWNGTTSQTNSVIYDNGTFVGIGTTTPSALLDINGSFAVKTTSISIGGNGDVNVW